jgi:preprotein translocase subunit YajC
MSLAILAATAAAAAPAAAPAGAGFTMLLPILLLVFMYFVMIRPHNKRQKELRETVAKIAKGDEVITGGGLAGRITDIGENFFSVEVADGVVVKVQKGAISAVLPKGTLKSA